MPTANFISANGKSVRIQVEREGRSGILIKEFVHEGVVDYIDKMKEGYWVVAKTDTIGSNLGHIIREALREELGREPLGMPETAVSHLIVFLCEGPTDRSEEELLSHIGNRIIRGEIVFDSNRAAQAKIATLRLQEQHLRSDLELRDRTKPARPSVTDRNHFVFLFHGRVYHQIGGKNLDVEEELASVLKQLAELTTQEGR